MSPGHPLAGRAAALVAALDLASHPEGGWYRELFRSGERVTRTDGAPRDALTTIYFLLARGTHSRWHRVEADEVWHHYEGAPLELLWVDASMTGLHRVRLGPVEVERPDGARPVHTVPAGCWQAACTTGEYTLVGCSVGPGFAFDDFSLLDDRPDEAVVLRERFEEVGRLG